MVTDWEINKVGKQLVQFLGGRRVVSTGLIPSNLSQKHLVCGPVKVAGVPGTQVTAPEYYR